VTTTKSKRKEKGKESIMFRPHNKENLQSLKKKKKNLVLLGVIFSFALFSFFSHTRLADNSKHKQTNKN
jgi:hypothetical protein